eukprot:gene8408-1502_t
MCAGLLGRCKANNWRRFSRTTPHRLAMLRNMTGSMIKHGKITTTLPKAMEVRKFADRMVPPTAQAHALPVFRAASTGPWVSLLVPKATPSGFPRDSYVVGSSYAPQVTIAKDGSLLAKRRGGNPPATTLFPQPMLAQPNRWLYDPLLTAKAFAEFPFRSRLGLEPLTFLHRNGGYTRLTRLMKKRRGDNAQMAILEYLDANWVEHAPAEAQLLLSRINDMRVLSLPPSFFHPLIHVPTHPLTHFPNHTVPLSTPLYPSFHFTY